MREEEEKREEEEHGAVHQHHMHHVLSNEDHYTHLPDHPLLLSLPLLSLLSLPPILNHPLLTLQLYPLASLLRYNTIPSYPILYYHILSYPIISSPILSPPISPPISPLHSSPLLSLTHTSPHSHYLAHPIHPRIEVEEGEDQQADELGREGVREEGEEERLEVLRIDQHQGEVFLHYHRLLASIIKHTILIILPLLPLILLHHVL